MRTEADYEAALDEFGGLMTARAGTPEGDRLNVLSTLVEAYETEHHAIEAANSPEAESKSEADPGSSPG